MTRTMLAAAAGLLAIQIGLVLAALGGRFSYTLDDPYIHLALADQIALGHYGLDPAAAAAPSSSILYPFLLAALSLTGIGQFGPLLLTAAATLASALVLAIILGEVLPIERLGSGPRLMLAVGLLLGLNLVGLAMTGMEHALHVALTLIWVLGAMRFLLRGSVPPWWWLSALAEPLVRFEGATLWLAMVVLLLCHRRYRSGMALAIAGFALLGAFSAFLQALGLPLLPSSVLAKSYITGDGIPMPDVGPVQHVFDTVMANLWSRNGPTFLVSMLLLAAMIWSKRSATDSADGRMAQLATVALAVSLAHLALGRLGGFGRYEIYALTLNVVVLIVGFADRIERFARRAGPAARVAAWTGLALLFADYAAHSLRSGAAAVDIHDQHYQMYRMAAEFYRAPVAVNDLGRVSYRNPYPVLDLWGLGSEEARLARKADPTGRWMDDLARKHQVGLAMIYESWFASLPPGWMPVARLWLRKASVSAGDRVVTFYATAPDYVMPIQKALDGLATTLPDGASLDRLGYDRVVSGGERGGGHEADALAGRRDLR